MFCLLQLFIIITQRDLIKELHEDLCLYKIFVSDN